MENKIGIKNPEFFELKKMFRFFLFCHLRPNMSEELRHIDITNLLRIP